jgi:hypothetical protein
LIVGIRFKPSSSPCGATFGHPSPEHALTRAKRKHAIRSGFCGLALRDAEDREGSRPTVMTFQLAFLAVSGSV